MAQLDLFYQLVLLVLLVLFLMAQLDHQRQWLLSLLRFQVFQYNP
jgi:hypothetical protein